MTQTASTSATATLAEYAATLEYASLPPEAVTAVKHLILDSLGTALAASTQGDGCQELVAMVESSGGREESTVLGFGHRGPAPMVALANGGLVHALNYDAGGAGHLGVVALVAPLAAAEYVGGQSGKDFIASSAAGCEIAARMARAVEREDREGQFPFLAGQILGYVGAAAGAGRVLGLSPLEMQSALALATMQAAGSRQVVLDGDPPAKAIYGAFPNQGGVQAALLSKFGLRADCAALEGSAGFYAGFYRNKEHAEGLTDDLGSRFCFTDVRYKPWPTSGVVAPYIEAALALREEYELTPDQIDHVLFTVSMRARHWCEPVEERRAPPTSASAANSIFFGIANALLYGEVTLEQFMPAGLANPTVRALTHRTEFKTNAEASATSALTVWTTDGRALHIEVEAASKPVTEAQLIAKFNDCARYSKQPLSPDRVRAIVDQVLHLEEASDATILVRQLN